jgi:hypothetical protein
MDKIRFLGLDAVSFVLVTWGGFWLVQMLSIDDA